MSEDTKKKVVDEDLVNAALKVLEEKGKMNESGSVLTLNASDHSNFLKEQGIPKPIQERIVELETAKRTADVRKATQMLDNQIKEVGKSGGDPNTCTATVKTMLPQGKDEITITGKRVFPNPQDPGNHSEHYGHVRLTAKRDRMLDDNELDKAAATIEKAILG